MEDMATNAGTDLETNAGVTLGAPLSPTATKVLIIGAGELGKELTMSFQRLGVETHTVGSHAHAPAHQVSHFAHLVDVRDTQALNQLVREIRPDYVIPEVETIDPDLLTAIEAQQVATVVPSAKACELTAAREGLRRAATEELGIPTTAYAFAASYDEFVETVKEMGFPCIVKPAVFTSGRGHTVLEDDSQLRAAWEEAHFDHSRDDEEVQVIVERFVDFDFEITLLCSRGIDPATGKLATWFSEPIGYTHAGGRLKACWQPTAMQQAALDNARSMAARITNHLGGRGVFAVEMFISGDEVYFSNVTPRPSDTGVVTLMSQRFSQFDLHARAILGLPVDSTLVSPAAAVYLHAEGRSRNVSFAGVDKALAVPEADVRLFGKTATYPGRRLGVVVASGETIADSLDRAREAAGAIEVVEA